MKKIIINIGITIWMIAGIGFLFGSHTDMSWTVLLILIGILALPIIIIAIIIKRNE